MQNFQEYKILSSNEKLDYNLLILNSNKSIQDKNFVHPLKLFRSRNPGESIGNHGRDMDTKQEVNNTTGTTTDTTSQGQGQAQAQVAPAPPPKRKTKRTKTMLMNNNSLSLFYKKTTDPELYPFLLTDADHNVSNSFLGTHEAGLDNANHILLIPNNNNTFTVKSVHKWYKFNPKITYKTLNIDQAENFMSKQEKSLAHSNTNPTSRWLMKNINNEENGQGNNSIKEIK